MLCKKMPQLCEYWTNNKYNIFEEILSCIVLYFRIYFCICGQIQVEIPRTDSLKT